MVITSSFRAGEVGESVKLDRGGGGKGNLKSPALPDPILHLGVAKPNTESLNVVPASSVITAKEDKVLQNTRQPRNINDMTK